MNSQIKTPWKKVISVFPKDNYTLELKWEDGQQSTLSLESRINTRDIFWRLRNPRYFNQVSVVIHWDDYAGQRGYIFLQIIC
ncbi:DUF2442 domain-containing protein [candidate division KSB1 bacterium]|nr:DUF2442 domain-containing protein [candidate division KSB1 bacterium]